MEKDIVDELLAEGSPLSLRAVERILCLESTIAKDIVDRLFDKTLDKLVTDAVEKLKCKF